MLTSFIETVNSPSLFSGWDAGRRQSRTTARSARRSQRAAEGPLRVSERGVSGRGNGLIEGARQQRRGGLDARTGASPADA
ncbi:MAG: hypothetical protein EOP64_06970 [Sphingomonas sp.]|nr:MAG: hypothetical protein EOP64_06970 [Sphingomonas sp.]